MSPLDVVKFPELPVTLMEPELVLADPTVPSMEMLMTLSLMTSSLSPMIILSPSIVMFEPGGAFYCPAVYLDVAPVYIAADYCCHVYSFVGVPAGMCTIGSSKAAITLSSSALNGIPAHLTWLCGSS